jgi:hypothetical protein
MARKPLTESLYDLVSGDEDARACADIPDEACAVVPGNFFRQVAAGVATKLGDALSDPKLVLTWLLNSVGASAAAVGVLVPIREAGALVPQLAVGGWIRRFPIRKWFWVGGSILQGATVLGMAAATLLLGGRAVGWTVAGLLALFSVGRAVCSVSSKDLVGKTVPRRRRGRLGGIAATTAGLLTLAVGLYFTTSRPSGFTTEEFAILLAVAGSLWGVGAVLMARLEEVPGATSGARNALLEALRSLSLLRTDADFRGFCIARALLASTVLTMPFYVILAREMTGGRLSSLGTLLIASAAAQSLSATVWGYLADRSSRRTLAGAGFAAGILGVATYFVAGTSLSGEAAVWVYAGLFFLLGLAHTGIRLGRKTYLVDMAPAEQRAGYVAVSNTLIGIVLLLSGAFGLLTPSIGARGVVLVFAVLGLLGGGLGLLLRET